MLKKISTTLLSALFIAPLIASAQNEGRWYNVEVLIFKNLEGAQQTTEVWPQDIKLTYPEKYQYLVDEISNESFTPITEEEYLLNSYEYALKKNENYQVLFHQGWKQQMENIKDAPAIIINGGNTIEGIPELTGSITIHIARYLHVVTDLWLTHFLPNSNKPSWPTIPDAPESSPFAFEYAQTGSNIPVATMRTKRKMRSKELHYIDHPLLGILVTFTPIEMEPQE